MPTSIGWIVQNNSLPIRTDTWFQGNSAKFSANSGGPDDYFACNFNSQGSSTGGISNFLITPTINLANGGVIQFATRTVTASTVYPDRLQLLISQGTGKIGSGTSAVGTFTTKLLDINPLYSGSNSGAVSSGCVNGYPNTWTVYTMTLSGITGSVAGRFAFRYLVDDGGPNGANSNCIGIDDVVYGLPCATPTTIVGANGAVEVINTLGQVILTTIVSEKETINTTGMAEGIYFIKVKNADTKATQFIKVIKD